MPNILNEIENVLFMFPWSYRNSRMLRRTRKSYENTCVSARVPTAPLVLSKIHSCFYLKRDRNTIHVFYFLSGTYNFLLTIYFSEPPPLTGAWKDTHMMRGKKQQVRYLSNIPQTLFFFLLPAVLKCWTNG